ncbi:MAG: arylsulfatase A-like enzyme [Glaciecola sp.]|jgi:arylsulfatase A-like enzyme
MVVLHSSSVRTATSVQSTSAFVFSILQLSFNWIRCVLAGGLLLASCSVEAAGPDWVDLTQNFDSVTAFEEAASDVWADQITVGERSFQRRGVWLHREIRSGEWENLGRGFWRIRQERTIREQWNVQVLPKMFSAGQVVEPLDGTRAAYWGALLDHYPPGQLPINYRHLAGSLPAFALGDKWVYWIGDSNEASPGVTRLSTWLDFGSQTDRDSRLEWGSISCQGFPLFTGVPQTIEVPASGLTRLDFASATWAGPEGDAVQFKVFFEDEVIWSHPQSTADSERIEFHSLVLPRSVRTGSKLRFEVQGPATIGAILTPRIYSLDWAQHRRTKPDLVMYSAGSFRADNLKALGGDVRIAPNLNALADEGVCFTQAYTPATHALLANASIVTGLYPQQIPMPEATSVLPAKVVTLAEHLRSQGYRTVAITDGGTASRRFGFAQGFEWFEENLEARENPEGNLWVEHWPMLASVERILKGNDGRPLFLYVHSQRLQWPYRVSEKVSRDSLGRSNGMRGTNQGHKIAAKSILPGKRRNQVSNGQALASYRGASMDSDLAFGEFRRLVQTFGTLQDGYLVFLGDHGEAFGGHGAVGHGNSVWQTEAHVPLIISGPSMRRRKVTQPVSLAALPHTLVELLGVQPFPGFIGPHLMAADQDQGVFVFQGFGGVDCDDQVAVIRGTSKGIFRWQGGLLAPDDTLGVFDVIRDPGEEHPQSVDGDAARILLPLMRQALPRLLQSSKRPNRVSAIGR